MSNTGASSALSILPITQCPIAAPILWRTTEAFLAAIHKSPANWLRTPNQPLDQLELFTTADESYLQFTLYLRTQAKTVPARLIAAFTTLCESLRTQIPELTGAGIAFLPPASTDRSRRTEIPRPGPTWGAPGLNYKVADTTYWVPRTAFFQINRFLLPELLALVISTASAIPEAQTHTRVGPLRRRRPLLQSSRAHLRPGHCRRDRRTRSNGTSLHQTSQPASHQGHDTRLPPSRGHPQRERPSLIVLDPPRSGAGPEICALLVRVAAPTLIYVSCSPQTLPADLVTLTASGYSVSGLHLIDLFPQTTHFETATHPHPLKDFPRHPSGCGTVVGERQVPVAANLWCFQT